jgi:hypothetical protein
VDRPRDSRTLRLAVAGLGLATTVVLVGICLILAFGAGETVKQVHHVGSAHATHAHLIHTTRSLPSEVPTVLWAFAAALGGALLGLMVPEPDTKSPAPWIALAALAAIVLVVLGKESLSGSPELESVVAAAGAAFVAILVPTPAAPEPTD